MTEVVLLREALMSPASVTTMSAAQWDLLIRQARRANLLGRLGQVLEEAQLLQQVPLAPRQHLLAAALVAERQAISARWEVECLTLALVPIGAPVVLLKGAAYVLGNIPVAKGRLFSDIDILVPRRHIAAAEAALMLHGWQASGHDAYDQHYYRAWMHEVPPMRHVRRDTTLDLHHDILPSRARDNAEIQALLEGAIRLPGDRELYVLGPPDMLAHSATHLLHEGEFANGMRDLFDIDGLLRFFEPIPGFWEELVPRAASLGLSRPLYYALRLSVEMLQTPVPPEVLAAAQMTVRPSRWLASLILTLYKLALRPTHASVETTAVRLARFVLYLRAHWLRLPWQLLLYHLGRKAVLRIFKPAEQAAEQSAPRPPGDR